MVKRGELGTKPKSTKINLDLITSTSEESGYLDTAEKNSKLEEGKGDMPVAKQVKKHALSSLQRRQIIKKRLNNVNSQTIQKYKLDTMVYMEKNKEMAIELEKQKHLVQMTKDELNEYKREVYELKEYVNHLEQKNSFQNELEPQGIDYKMMNEICDSILDLQKKVMIIKNSLPSYVSGSTRCSVANNTTLSRVSTTNDTTKFSLVSPIDVSIEAMNKMQQLAVENSLKLQQKQREDLEANSNKLVVYNFDEEEEDYENDVNNEFQQEQYLDFEVNNNVINTSKMLGVIEEENEDDEELLDYEEDSNEETEEESPKNCAKVNLVSNDNVKSKNQTSDNKKHVSFEFISTPPSRQLQKFVIFNDENGDRNTYYEELENRPVILNDNIAKTKPKRVLTPKRVNRKKNINEELHDEEAENIEKENDVIISAQVEIDKNKRKKSLKKSLDRRRSQVFNTIESPSNINKNIVEVTSDHEPQIQPIEIYEENIVKPLVPAEQLVEDKDANEKKIIEEKNVDKENEQLETKKTLIRNNRSKSKLIPQESVNEETPKVDEQPVNGAIEVKKTLKRASRSRSRLDNDDKSNADSTPTAMSKSPQQISKDSKKPLSVEPAEFAKPPINKKPPVPKKDKTNKPPTENTVVTNLNENTNDALKVLNQVSKELASDNEKLISNRALKEDNTNENTDPQGAANNLSISSKKRYSNEKANLSDTSNVLTECPTSANSSMNL